MKTVPVPPGVSSEVSSVYVQANKILAENRTAIRRINNRKSISTLIGICVILAILVGIYIAYDNRSELLSYGKSLFPSQPLTAQTVTAPAVANSCPALKILVTNGSLEIAVPQTGQCYSIPVEYQSAWQQTFSNVANVETYTARIGGDQDFVQQAIQNSLQTNILDLRQVTVTATPSPTPVPQYEKRDVPIDIEDLVKVMQQLNIRSLTGTAAKHDRFNWGLYYTSTDYLILNTVGMPDSCQNATQSITVSLDPFEGAMNIGNGWVTCQ